jgi:hypothetical protein
VFDAVWSSAIRPHPPRVGRIGTFHLHKEQFALTELTKWHPTSRIRALVQHAGSAQLPTQLAFFSCTSPAKSGITRPLEETALSIDLMIRMVLIHGRQMTNARHPAEISSRLVFSLFGPLPAVYRACVHRRGGLDEENSPPHPQPRCPLDEFGPNAYHVLYSRTIMAEPTYEELKARLADLEKQGPRRTGSLEFRVGAKGGVSVYGLGRFPVTLYYEQWMRLLDASDKLREFLEENKAQLKLKE